MTVGTKSVLFGAHAFWLHPFFVAAAWTLLFGFPWDLRFWVAFFVHDLGYLGKPNLDGPEGEEHPRLGARIMSVFDKPQWCGIDNCGCVPDVLTCERCESAGHRWHDFSLLHSRYFAKRLGLPFSRLCVADKLSFTLTPRWLYLPMVNATGEIHEYLKMARAADTAAGFKAADYRNRQIEWHTELCRYMREWVAAHKDGAEDTWTSADRHARTDSGVWK